MKQIEIATKLVASICAITVIAVIATMIFMEKRVEAAMASLDPMYFSEYMEPIPVEELAQMRIEAQLDEYIKTHPEVTEAESSSVVETDESLPETNAQQSYTEQDVNLLAQLMYAEEGVFLQRYDEHPKKVERVFKLAGSVVLHRMENSYMGETIYDVIYAPGQYAGQTLQRVSAGQDVPEMVYTWAEELLRDGPIGPNNLVYQAEFSQGKPYEKIWNQVFCVEPKYAE